MKIRRHKVLLFCSVGLCVVSFLNYYKVLQHVPLLQQLSSQAANLKTSIMASDLFWREKSVLLSRPLFQDSLDQRANSQDVPPGQAEASKRKRMDGRPVHTGGGKVPHDLHGTKTDLHLRYFHLQDDIAPYFTRSKSGALCFQEGTSQVVSADLQGSGARDSDQRKRDVHPEQYRPAKDRGGGECVCREGWYGPHCGVPTMVQHSNLHTKSHLVPREVARRVINAININHEFDLLHARFHELAHAVDLFLVCESNFTAYGDHRPLHFLQLLLNGTFDYIKHKILYVFLDHFPKGGRVNGWIADDYLRTFLSKNGMSRVQGLRPDDIFLIDDADEIPAHEGILFLKLFDGWTEPFGIHMRKSLYGFFWKQPGTLDVISGCTVAMLFAVYKGDGILLRRREYYSMPGFRKYENKTGHILVPWSLGNPVHYAGWHCSWCFKPEGIYLKLVSAQNGDFPRWGDFVEKRKLSYIKELIRTGGWFDGSVPNYPPTNPKEHMFAPKYLLDNFERYSYLLENPYTKKQGL
ncbi:beta-1,4-mannosyl-glycoprotein 4-beta-N-acetylglucosaminyltransferase a [Chanos chanos]|uniref:Beta-1,4-mannosyl-glycoprotein 4-beta-N-acetylglucosaminyltransferase a n=1 Tax=Chanos chanos TaxID=29144 RepID=A0A6J2WY56_CHACN|nr:beta-1,4-mannosyl-glycoprotein 4-beta-N-acetylglucosaminyltransferase-like [Chanos chanos]